MDTLNFIAELWGFGFLSTGLALLINGKNIKKLFQFAESEIAMFYSGILVFLMGVASILSYNLWSSSWGVVVTVFGWLTVLKGLFLLFWFCCS